MVKTNSIDSSLSVKTTLQKNILFDLGGKLVGISVLISIIFCGSLIYNSHNISSENVTNVIIGAGVVFFISSLIADFLSRYPGNQPRTYLLMTVVVFYIILLGGIILLRIDYSRSALLLAFPALYIALYTEMKIYQKINDGYYGVIPVGFYAPLLAANDKKFSIINEPGEPLPYLKGVIVDKNEQLDENWQRFVAHTLSEGKIVLDTVTAYESITGKSPLNHYCDISEVEVNPRRITLAIKRLIESSLVIVTSPLWLLIILITAILIKMESKGPAIFTQRRIGRGGREFTMFKLRSMCIESESNGAQFATTRDPRITKIGKIIRKTRIDELPQFINILKGDMSLIGPRPEQASFVEKFEKEIPLYSYRHVVRPGITGWAQVTQGYASSTDETREKLAHDFYYVKNLSLWLDIDIVIKTIKTMLTGFGAR